MVLLVLLCVTFILNSVLLGRTKFARVIMLYYVGCFVLVTVGIMYFVKFTNYSYTNQWDYALLRLISNIRVSIYTLSIIHNIGICILMFATEECVRLVLPMNLKVRLLLLMPIVLMFVLNLPELRWYMYIKQNEGLSYNFWRFINEGVHALLVLTAGVYYIAPIVFYIRYIFKTKIFVKKRYGTVGLAGVVLTDIIILLLFIIGVFSSTMFYNMDLLSFPKRDMGVYYDNAYIIIVFTIMILNFVLLVWFTPFEKYGIANMQNRKKKNDVLSNDVYMMLHSYKNRFLSTEKLATLAIEFERKEDFQNVGGLLETIKNDSMNAAVGAMSRKWTY